MQHSNLQDALEYARLGWHVFPCDPETKAPKVSRGFHSATTDEVKIRQWWADNPQASIGVACLASGLFVMDLDRNHSNCRDGVMAWKFITQTEGGGDDNAELVATTAKGGLHIIYRRPDKKTITRITTTNNVWPESGIDCRGDGGYFIVPSACEPNRQWHIGDPFDTAPSHAPAWVLSRVSTDGVRAEGNPSGGEYKYEMPLSSDDVESIRSALTCIDNDDHDVWLKVGMALRSTGARDQALALWAEWSQSSPKWDEKAAIKRWRSMREFRHDGSEITINTLYALAKDGGWKGAPPVKFAPPAEELKVEMPETTEAEPFPMELFNFPGAVSDLASACLLFGKVSPQPAFAFASALTLVSTVLNRRVEDADGLRTQLYMAIVGDTGCGKDAPLKFPFQILEATQIDRLKDRIGPSDFSSEPGLRNSLSKHPACLVSKDEFGLWVTKLHSPKMSSADQTAKSFFMELYSAGKGSILKGMAYANEKDRPQVDLTEPSMSFLGAGTAVTIFGGASVSSMQDGFLNRIIFSHVDNEAPFEMPEDEQSEHVSWEDAIKIVTELDSFFGQPSPLAVIDGSGASPKPAHVMNYTDSALAYLRQMDRESRIQRRSQEISGLTRAMMARRVQSIKRVAMILSAGQSLSGMITEEAVRAAEKFIVWSQERTMRECSRYIGGNDFEVAQNHVISQLKDSGLTEFGRGDVVSSVRGLRPRDVEDVIVTLGDLGWIENISGPGAARELQRFRIIK